VEFGENRFYFVEFVKFLNLVFQLRLLLYM